MMSVEDYFQLDRNSSDAHYGYIEGHIRMPVSPVSTHLQAILLKQSGEAPRLRPGETRGI